MPTEESIARQLPKAGKGHLLGETERWILKRIANSPREMVDLSRFKTAKHQAAARNLLERGMLETRRTRKGLKLGELRIQDLIQLGKGRAPAEFYEPTEPRTGIQTFLALHPKKAGTIRAAFKRKPN